DLTQKEEKGTRELRRFEYEDDRLRTKIAQLQRMLDGTTARLSEMSLLRMGSVGFNVEPLSRPGIGSRTGTGLAQTLLAGLAVGLVLGVGLAYLADMADKSFRTPEEIRRRLGLPGLAPVPLLEAEGGPAGRAAGRLGRA